MKDLRQILIFIIFKKNHEYFQYMVKGFSLNFIIKVKSWAGYIPNQCFNYFLGLQSLEFPAFKGNPLQVFSELLYNFVKEVLRLMRVLLLLFGSQINELLHGCEILLLSLRDFFIKGFFFLFDQALSTLMPQELKNSLFCVLLFFRVVSIGV